jgi:hypothetical protein
MDLSVDLSCQLVPVRFACRRTTLSPCVGMRGILPFPVFIDERLFEVFSDSHLIDTVRRHFLAGAGKYRT